MRQELHTRLGRGLYTALNEGTVSESLCKTGPPMVGRAEIEGLDEKAKENKLTEETCWAQRLHWQRLRT